MASIHWKIIFLTTCLCWSSCLSQNQEEDLLAFVREAVEGIKDVSEKVADLRERLDGLNESQMAVLRKVEEMDHKFSTKFGELQKIERSIEGCSSVEQQISNLTMLLTKDHCTEGSHCCSPLPVCEDAIASYRCICLPGTTGDGFSCEDVDECASGEDRCHDHAQCSNIIGNYTCACNPGFDGDGFNCRDVDECASGEDRCHDHAQCSNIVGNYTCACNLGFDGDGSNCIEDPCVPPSDSIQGLLGCVTAIKEKKTWFDAFDHCSELGGRLVQGWDSRAQAQLIQDYVDKAFGGTDYWLWVGSRGRRWTEGEVEVPIVVFHRRTPPSDSRRKYGLLSTYSHDESGLVENPGDRKKYFICQRTSASSSSFSSTN